MALYLEYELLQAITEENVEAVNTLLQAGADPNAGIFAQETAISKTIDNGNEMILDSLLQHGSLHCMIEEKMDEQNQWLRKRRWAMRRKEIGAITPLFITKIGIDCLATWMYHGRCQSLIRLFSHYLWFINRSVTFGPVSLPDLRSRYRDPWTYARSIIQMLVHNQLYIWMASCVLRFILTLTLPPSSGIRSDLILAIPMRFCIDCLVVLAHSLFRWIHYPSDGYALRQVPLPLPAIGLWKSPAERVLDSILTSKCVSEKMVLKLLHAGLLASQPYESSVAAQTLLQTALIRCWPMITRFFLNSSISFNTAQSQLPSSSLGWPVLLRALEFYVPDVTLGDIHEDCFKTRRIPPHLWIDNGPYCVLVRSAHFQRLATSEIETDKETCLSMIDLLYENGADPLQKDGRGLDALSHLACSSCALPIFQKMASLSQKARYELPPVHDEGLEPWTPALYQAINIHSPDIEKIQILLDIGISPELEGPVGWTPLLGAAYMNTGIEAISLLLQAGADPNNGGVEGYPPIIKTLDDASIEKFKIFLKYGADSNATDKYGKTILERVIEHSADSIIRWEAMYSLLKRGAVVYTDSTQLAPAFITAARRRNVEGWDEVILEDLFTEIPQIQRPRQLNLALQAAMSLSYSSTYGGNFVTISWLLDHGADPSFIEGGATSILSHVCSLVRPEEHQFQEQMKTFLQEHRPNLNPRDGSGQTALRRTILQGSRDFSLLLLKYGADPNAPDTEGMAPLQHLCSMGSLVYNIGHSHEHIFGDGQNQQYSGVRGQSAFQHETRWRLLKIRESLAREEVFQSLVHHGADLAAVDAAGRSLLMLASEKGDAVLAAQVLYSSRETGFVAPLTAIENSGKTALHLAASSGSLETLKVLLWPRNILEPTLNPWRGMAMEGEAKYFDQQRKSKLDRRLDNLKGQIEEYKKKEKGVPSFLVSSIVLFEHLSVEFTVGDAELVNITLPNISTSTWQLDKSEVLHTTSENLRDSTGRTPLHSAALTGHVASVELLLRYADVDIGVVDCDGKTAEDLALDGSFYDVYAAIQNHRNG